MDGTLQRVDGAASVRLGPQGLERLSQRGSAKAILPAAHGRRAEAVFLNTAGGVTGGDRLSYALTLTAGTATGTTQTAERAYASPGGAARVDVTLRAGPGAQLAWLPQETILFEDSHLHRRTTAELAEGATLVGCEMLVLGRRAMGERPERLRLADRREVRMGGAPLWIEPFALTPEALGPSPALLGGAAALATLYVVGPGAEDVRFERGGGGRGASNPARRAGTAGRCSECGRRTPRRCARHWRARSRRCYPCRGSGPGEPGPDGAERSMNLTPPREGQAPRKPRRHGRPRPPGAGRQAQPPRGDRARHRLRRRGRAGTGARCRT